jgi:hypothetical protein
MERPGGVCNLGTGMFHNGKTAHSSATTRRRFWPKVGDPWLEFSLLS